MLTTPPVPKKNLIGLTEKGLRDFFISIDEKPFRALQVFKWIHQRGLLQFEKMTDLSLSLREKLAEIAEIRPPEIALLQASIDGTRKWLLRLPDGNQIETVFIPEKDRGTLCVSSQVGCALNCRFCSTATQGFNRNLSTAEIIGQVFLAKNALSDCTSSENASSENASSENVFSNKITNVVMMGMGEPLLNYEAVMDALNIMRADNAYGLSRRRVTLSTAGLVPKILSLGQDADVSLAVSLHAPNDTLRDELVPLNKKYPIAELMQACRSFVEKDKRRHITMEYVMLKNVNDTPLHAKQLIKVLQGVPCKVNLIPFNPFPMTKFECSENAVIEIFQTLLMQAGLITTVRKTRGQDIDAACGQLKGKIFDRTKRAERLKKLHFKEETWIEPSLAFG